MLKILAAQLKSNMNKYEDKEASTDDYSHERKLRIDGRYEAAHGKMADAKNDFDHAHALKIDAHHDAMNRAAGGGENYKSSIHKVHKHSRMNNPHGSRLSRTEEGIATLYTGKRENEG